MHLFFMRSRVPFARGYTPGLPTAVVGRRGCLPHEGEGGMWPLPGVSLPAQAPLSAASSRRPCSGGDCERARAGLRSAGPAAGRHRLRYGVDGRTKSALAHRVQSTLLEEKCQARPITIQPKIKKRLAAGAAGVAEVWPPTDVGPIGRGAQGQHQPRPPPTGRGERTDGYQSLCGPQGGGRERRRPPQVVEAEAARTVNRSALMSQVAPGPAGGSAGTRRSPKACALH